MKQRASEPSADPRGRLDLLLLGCSEIVARRVEQVIGVPIWTPDLVSAVEQLIDEAGVPDEPIDVGASIAETLLAAAGSERQPRVRGRKGSARRRHVR